MKIRYVICINARNLFVHICCLSTANRFSLHIIAALTSFHFPLRCNCYASRHFNPTLKFSANVVSVLNNAHVSTQSCSLCIYTRICLPILCSFIRFKIIFINYIDLRNIDFCLFNFYMKY